MAGSRGGVTDLESVESAGLVSTWLVACSKLRSGRLLTAVRAAVNQPPTASSTLCRTFPWRALPCRTVPYRSTLYRTVPDCCTVSCRA